MESIEADAHKITRDLEVVDAGHEVTATEAKCKLCPIVVNDYYRGLLTSG